jgi:hypothetical protein
MADTQAEETKKTPEVELDTDDVKAENVEVKESKETKEPAPNLNVGEVDLGYTDHVEKKEEKAKIVVEEKEEKTEAPQPTEQPKDDLSKITDNVQKRIDKLTYRAREAERREKAATEYAKGLQSKFDNSMAKFDDADEKYIKEFDARVDAQREQVKNKLRGAIEDQNADKIMEANDELTKLAVEKEKARIKLAEREKNTKAEIKQKDTKEPARAPETMPEISEKAKAWAQKNEWFGNDRVMTGAAWNIHEDLVARGIDVESDTYYNSIDSKMQEYFPQRFGSDSTDKGEAKKPVQTVASAGRKQSGRRTVKLTKSQVAIAKKLGVPLEEYAKFVKEDV